MTIVHKICAGYIIIVWVYFLQVYLYQEVSIFYLLVEIKYDLIYLYCFRFIIWDIIIQ